MNLRDVHELQLFSPEPKEHFLQPSVWGFVTYRGSATLGRQNVWNARRRPAAFGGDATPSPPPDTTALAPHHGSLARCVIQKAGKYTPEVVDNEM